MSRFRISLFSRFKIESDSKRSLAGFEARKVQELFSYLLLFRDRLHSRETLAELLWGDISSLRARKYLRQALWQLQTALKSEDDIPGNEILLVDSEWVGINPQADLWLDVAELEEAYANAEGTLGYDLDPQVADALSKALDLHTGSLLEGWYHDWCIFERERLQIMYLAMLNKLMDQYEARGDFECGLSYGRFILQHDRAHERTHWRMMLLYYLAGDRTAALRQYESCASALEEELGVKPARRTNELYEQICADEVAVPVSPVPFPHTPAPAASPLRAVQLTQLDALLSQFQREVRQYMDVGGLASVE